MFTEWLVCDRAGMPSLSMTSFLLSAPLWKCNIADAAAQRMALAPWCLCFYYSITPSYIWKQRRHFWLVVSEKIKHKLSRLFILLLFYTQINSTKKAKSINRHVFLDPLRMGLDNPFVFFSSTKQKIQKHRIQSHFFSSQCVLKRALSPAAAAAARACRRCPPMPADAPRFFPPLKHHVTRWWRLFHTKLEGGGSFSYKRLSNSRGVSFSI